MQESIGIFPHDFFISLGGDAAGIAVFLEPLDVGHIIVDGTIIQTEKESILEFLDETEGVFGVALEGVQAATGGKIAIEIGIFPE